MGIRMAVGITFLGLISMVYFLSSGFDNSIITIIRDGNADNLAAYIRSFGIWAVLVSVLLSILMTFGLVIPFVILAAANGAVFGIVGGTIVSWTGEVAGAMIAFTVYRYIFQPAIVKRLSHTPYWSYMDKLSSKHGFKTVLIARILPIIPSGILTAVAAVSNISVRDFWWATAWGKIPSVFVKVMVGYDLLHIQTNKYRLLIGVLVLVILYLAAAWYRKRG